MHTVQLKLDTTKYDKCILANRFFALFHVHNVCVKRAIKLLNRLNNDKYYQTCLKEYIELNKKDKRTSVENKRRKHLSNEMKRIRQSIGLSETELQSYMKVCGKQFNKKLSSSQIQKEVTRVYQGVEKILFSNGKRLHFKCARDFDTLPGKNPTNGIIFDKNTMSIKYLELEMKCKLPKKDDDFDYIMESLSHKISYCEISRKMFNNGFHYYVIIYLADDSPKKEIISNGSTMGIDPGVSTFAGVSDRNVFLEELAPDCKKYDKKIIELQQKMENSKRQSNPNKYNDDGTIKKGNKDKWIFTNTYYKLRDQLKTLYRKKSAYTKCMHRNLCDRLMKDSNVFIIEEMNFSSLQKRTKKTERQEKESEI